MLYIFRYVITHSHPWTVYAIIICLHWSWTLGIAKGMMSDRRYNLSYGQVDNYIYLKDYSSFSSGLDNFPLFGHSTPPIGYIFAFFEEKVPICVHQSHTKVLL